MFKVKEEYNGSKRYKARLVVKGFQQKREVDDMLVAGSDMAEFNKPKWLLPLVFEMKDRCSEKQAGVEREVKFLRSFNWPTSKLITDDGVLPERVQRVPYVRCYRKVRAVALSKGRKVRAVALLKGRWFEVYRDYLRRRAVK
nr:hypothetical protein [Tanacetum cinerariifolium]